MAAKLQYLKGFGNEFSSEIEKGILPVGQNSPQKVARNLYAEQISGTAFTVARAENRRTWAYRLKPAVVQGAFKRLQKPWFETAPLENAAFDPNPLRWDPHPYSKKKNFFESFTTVCACGSPAEQRGSALHLYAASATDENLYFYNADGEMIFIPWENSLFIKSEFGCLSIEPGEIAMIPRGVKFQVLLPQGKARGYVCENYGRPFRLPELGPLGANGLANARDFESPVAWFEEKKSKCELVAKLQGHFWSATLNDSPLNVLAWHGNYVPFRYNLFLFNTMGSVSYDHPDPSIYTVLTSPSDYPGTANCDFVIFPPRWLVAENTFRPPYFHRNIMSEAMGLIKGVYDAKEKGFLPGAVSVHNQMSGHGPETEVFVKASEATLKPQKIDHTMAFMLESRYVFAVSAAAAKSKQLQKDYRDCWQTL